MKKVLAVVAVLALTVVSSVAYAEVSFDGSIEFLMRSFKNTTDWNDKAESGGDLKQTYERVRLGVNAKNDNVKGRIQIENDWDVWGDTGSAGAFDGFEGKQNNAPMYVREGWLDFNLPFGLPGHVKVGRQFLQLGNGWFFRSAKYGSDAWLVGFPGKNTVAFVNVKAAERSSYASDDTDAYVLLDTFKIDDKNTVGAYYTYLNRRQAGTTNAATHGTLGLHGTGQVGPVKLAGEFAFQSGEVDNGTGAAKTDLSGMLVVLQASMPVDALTVRATVASGTGDDPATTGENEQFQSVLDKDPRYTLVYEYLMKTAANASVTGATQNTGFSNTTAMSIGADFKINNMFTVGADFWMLSADQKVTLNAGGAANTDTDLGTEIDVKLNVTLSPELTWNTTYGSFAPGKAYKSAAGVADTVTAIQSVLSYKFK